MSAGQDLIPPGWALPSTVIVKIEASSRAWCRRCSRVTAPLGVGEPNAQRSELPEDDADVVRCRGLSRGWDLRGRCRSSGTGTRGRRPSSQPAAAGRIPILSKRSAACSARLRCQQKAEQNFGGHPRRASVNHWPHPSHCASPPARTWSFGYDEMCPARCKGCCVSCVPEAGPARPAWAGWVSRPTGIVGVRAWLSVVVSVFGGTCRGR